MVAKVFQPLRDLVNFATLVDCALHFIESVSVRSSVSRDFLEFFTDYLLQNEGGLVRLEQYLRCGIVPEYEELAIRLLKKERTSTSGIKMLITLKLHALVVSSLQERKQVASINLVQGGYRICDCT